jgi:hypothetical protein
MQLVAYITDDGCKEHLKHVECLAVIKATSCSKLVVIEKIKFFKFNSLANVQKSC